MRTTLNIDRDLLDEAQELSQSRTKTETVEMGLRLLVARESARRLALLAGKHPNVTAPRRRRPENGDE